MLLELLKAELFTGGSALVVSVVPLSRELAEFAGLLGIEYYDYDLNQPS